ncbi:hypothetical protein ACIF8T_40000 [Streptomyces sp. NPDC085946]|uniref:hypothetical protein n=1 Tax=Streptomyces sp. NPDC085946 TaxID=3365744 RepID=UPI0037D7AAC8
MSNAARLRIGDRDLVVRLPWRWALSARCRTMRLPLRFIDGIWVEPYWWRAVRPCPGRRYRFSPGRWCVGEIEHTSGRDFVALHARGPVLVVSALGRDAPYARLALSTRDPKADATWLRQITVQNTEKS